MTICKIAADCPHALKICCGTCEHKDTCESKCSSCDKWESCEDARFVDELPMQFESAVPDVIKDMTALLKLKEEIEEQEKVLKQQLLEAMEKYGVKSFDTPQIRLTYVAPTTKTTLDTKRLRKDHPGIVAEYSKTSDVSASVRITVK